MLAKERSAVFSLATIMSFRMLGLFMVLPVFSLYAHELSGTTPFLIGLALGIYGLTQACLQIPFGSLSDRIGRKPIITIGLILFALGSAVAALSHSIYGVIIGRALQGAGAIGSTILALVADLTPDEQRSKAMAMIGLAIGLSFSIAIIVGPMINHAFHLNGIFWTTMLLAVISILLLHTIVPNPPRLMKNPSVEPDAHQFKAVFKNRELLRLDLGIFSMHAILTATFIAIPLLLSHVVHVKQSEQTWLYLGVLVIAFILMVPFIIIAEKKRKMKPIFLGAIAAIILSQLLLLTSAHSALSIGITLLIFFTAFTLLEASLPSLVSKIAPIKRKGTAMGVYSSSQFFGIFIGGSLGGIIYGHFHLPGVFIFCIALGLIWLIAAISMKQPPYLSTFIFDVEKIAKAQLEKLSLRIGEINGINEVSANANEGLIYIKADKKIISKDELRKLIDGSNLH